jgi:hypothetical protein
VTKALAASRAPGRTAPVLKETYLSLVRKVPGGKAAKGQFQPLDDCPDDPQ